MTKPKGNKGPKRRGKGQDRAARAKLRPGIIESWEDFDEAAMREYLAAVADEFEQQLDEFEQALRSEN